MSSYQYDIDIMARIIGLLHSLPNDEHNRDYKRVVDTVNDYLHKYCKHDICNDEIDIDAERCATIRYCTKCYSTFN